MRERQWWISYARCRDQTEELGRLPRRTHDYADDETRSFEWLRRQRRNFDLLDQPQIAALEALAGFGWEPLMDRWFRHLLDLIAFEVREERLPRGRSNDRAEKSLARWRARQRAAIADGLSHQRITALAAVATRYPAVTFDPLYRTAAARLHGESTT
jgi:hypothetical protein